MRILYDRCDALSRRRETEIIYKERKNEMKEMMRAVMVAVVMYCLTIVCRYGTLLQKESDETL